MTLPNLAGVLLAQSAPPTGATATSSDALVVWVLALKRWYGSLTLSSPEALPDRTAWLALVGLVGPVVLAVAFQGPRRALAQLLDLAGLARLVSAGMGRLRRSAKLVVILLGATVVAWTAWEAPLHNRAEKKEELGLLLKSKSRGEFAAEQGVLAAVSPFRDVLALGDTFILLVGAAALVFKFSADRWGRFDQTATGTRAAGGWTTACWGGAGLYAMYRLASLLYDSEGLPPLGGCLVVEAGAVPLLMLMADGLLLAWVVAELRGADGGEEEEGFDVAGAITLVPGGMLACLLGLPARYAATAVGLILFHHTTQATGASAPWSLSFLRGWWLIGIQAGALAFVGLVAGLAASRGSVLGTIRGYGRVLKAEGGRLAALVALIALGVGATSSVAYFAVLAMPTQPWLLLAADSYAHYASLPIGLLGVAAMVELGSRVRETAKPIPSLADEPGIEFTLPDSG